MCKVFMAQFFLIVDVIKPSLMYSTRENSTSEAKSTIYVHIHINTHAESKDAGTVEHKASVT